MLSGGHGLMLHPCLVPMLHMNLGLQAVTPFMAFSHPGEEVNCQVLVTVLVNISLSSDLSASIYWLLASTNVCHMQLQCRMESSPQTFDPCGSSVQ